MHLQKIIALVSATTSFAYAVSAPTCKDITDTSNSMVQLVQMSDVPEDQLPMGDVLTEMKAIAPGLSKCLANTNIIDISNFIENDKEAEICVNTIDSYDPNLENELTNVFFADDLCPMLMDTVIPCLENSLVKLITKVMTSGGSCCDDFKKEVMDLTGTTLENAILKTAKMAVNILCSKRKINNVDQMCGYSMYGTVAMTMGQAMDGEDEEAVLYELLYSTAQIPTNQVCKAVNSERFTTTKGKTQTYLNMPNIKPIGSCYGPVDMLMTYLSKMKLWSTASGMDMSKLWGPDTCMDAPLLAKALQKDDSMLMKVAHLIDSIEKLFPSDETPEDPYNPQPHGEYGGHKWSQSGSGSLSHSRFGSGSAGSHTHDPKDEDDQLNHPKSNVEMLRDTLKNMEIEMRDVCLHIPTSVSCTQDNTVVTLAFPEVGPKATTPTPTTTPKTETKPAAPTPKPTSNGMKMHTSIMLASLLIGVSLNLIF